MKWIKKKIRAWLEGPYTNGEEVDKLLSDAELAVQKVQELEGLLRDMHGVLAEEQRKFDALCLALGVVVVSDFTTDLVPTAYIVSVNPEGVLGKHNENFILSINAERQALINQLLAFTNSLRKKGQ